MMFGAICTPLPELLGQSDRLHRSSWRRSLTAIADQRHLLPLDGRIILPVSRMHDLALEVLDTCDLREPGLAVMTVSLLTPSNPVDAA